MKRPLPQKLAIALLAFAGLGAAERPLQASADENAATYLVRSTLSQPAGLLVSLELLTITTSGMRAVIDVQQSPSSERQTVAAPIDANGVLDIATAEPSIACYNSAQKLHADADRAQTSSTISVAFAGNAVNVPLRVTPAALGGDDTNAVSAGGYIEGALDAEPAKAIGIGVDGSLVERRHELISAQFRETTTIASTHAAIAQATCAIVRVTEQAITGPV
jgi:hypothetical protein